MSLYPLMLYLMSIFVASQNCSFTSYVGKQLINSIGGQLKMSHHCLESAFMFYKLALSKRFTTGRKTIQVIGACLYLVSRTERTPRIFSALIT